MVAVGLALAVVACAASQAPPAALSGGDAAAPPSPVSMPASVLDGVFTADQATRGEHIFRVNCSTCHSTREFGALFHQRWSDGSVGDLFSFIAATMPQTAPGSLQPQEYADIIAYFLGSNDFPTGKAELPGDFESLRNVRMAPAP